MLDASAMSLFKIMRAKSFNNWCQFAGLFAYSLEPCVDHRFDCDSPFMQNECHNNPYSTMMLCPKSCGVCW